jgi:hypothetical protein
MTDEPELIPPGSVLDKHIKRGREIDRLRAALAAAQVELNRRRNGDDMDKRLERLTDMAIRKAREQRDAARAEADRLRDASKAMAEVVRRHLAEVPEDMSLTYVEWDSVRISREWLAALNATPTEEAVSAAQAEI